MLFALFFRRQKHKSNFIKLLSKVSVVSLQYLQTMQRIITSCDLAMNFYYSQKAVRVTTLMKRLRTSDQGDSAAAGLAAGVTADPSTPAPPAGSSDSVAAGIKAALKGNAPDAQTATTAALPLPSAARQDEQQQTRCNGDAPQMMSQRKED